MTRLPKEESIERAVALAIPRLRSDGFLAYPTETVWGLGACADRPRAIERLMTWKGRGANAPLAVLVSRPEAVESIGCRIDSRAARLIEKFWPGPLMLILPSDQRFAQGVASETGGLGVRCSPHPISRALAAALESEGLGPLTSTSLNRSGEPPATCLEQARALAPDSDDPAQPAWLGAAGFDAGGEKPSTIVDCTGAAIRILREGAISSAEVKAVLG